ncbi:hypothetical protein OHA40_29205 [Nocardia sp. NBC_00508]|uniref:hypothetical protein n=1 Tax=Nocardia sp. NBC_00508 TaxID=2975992 RepID=UPI002E807674|nr:hypothetical protein [Nocardia sp. NBC_00508]WUD65653.1 hypothetical protein OHA40_29205 [Nocardia sp. NBC_00508]
MTETARTDPPASTRSVTELIDDATAQISRLIREERENAAPPIPQEPVEVCG